MQKQNKTWAMVLGLVFVALVLCGVLARTVRAQDPVPTPDPTDMPLTFKCVAAFEPMLTLDVIWSKSPFEALRLKLNSIPRLSGDNTPPVITKVEFPTTFGSSSVLDDSVKIPSASTSLKFRVAGTDDVAIQSAFLYVDGREVTRNNGGAAALAENGKDFTITWDAFPIAVGWHEFTFDICDANGNCPAGKSWRMEKK